MLKVVKVCVRKTVFLVFILRLFFLTFADTVTGSLLNVPVKVSVAEVLRAFVETLVGTNTPLECDTI